MLGSFSDNVFEQTRAAINRINQTEKFFEDLRSGFSAYSRKSARLRDKLDDLGRILFGQQPTANLTENDSSNIGKVLGAMAMEMTYLADLRDWETQQVETKIISDISQYDSVCQAMREEVKINASIRNKEVLRKRAAEQRRGSTVLRADRDFEKIIEDFEEQKNKDLQQLLLNFVSIQLKVHLDGVNRLTQIYRKIKEIDCHKDAIIFKESVVNPKNATASSITGDDDVPSNSKLDKVRSQSMGALNTLMHHPTNPFRKHSKPQERLNKSQEDIVEAQPRHHRRSAPSVDAEPPRITLGRNETTEEEEDDETDQDAYDNRPTRLHVPKYPNYKR